MERPTGCRQRPGSHDLRDERAGNRPARRRETERGNDRHQLAAPDTGTPQAHASNIFGEDNTKAVLDALNVLKPTYTIPVPSTNTKQIPAALTDIYRIDLETDQGPWLEWLHDAAAGRRFITVMHACDIHFPFEHKPALEVFFQLVQHVQPDLIVVGSDAADFALISTFDKDADLDEATDDVLDEFERHWNPFIHRLKEASPRSQLVYIWGNHERRIRAFLNRQAPKFRKRILRDFTNIIRCGDPSSTWAIRTTCVWDHLLYTMAFAPGSMRRRILSSTPVVSCQ